MISEVPFRLQTVAADFLVMFYPGRPCIAIGYPYRLYPEHSTNVLTALSIAGCDCFTEVLLRMRRLTTLHLTFPLNGSESQFTDYAIVTITSI